MERAVILTRGKSLDPPLTELRRVPTPEPSQIKQSEGAQRDIARIVKETISAMDGHRSSADEHATKQKDEIVRALTETKGRVGGSEGAAARMGINRTMLISRMKKFGINPNQYS